jgi:hypothetical protein
LVLFLAIPLVGNRVRVVRPAVDFDKEPDSGIRKVCPAHEHSTVVEDLVLDKRHGNPAIEEYPQELVLEKALGSAINALMHLKEWTNDANTASPLATYATNDSCYIRNSEELESDTRAESTLNQPRTGSTKINDCSLRNRHGDATAPCSIAGAEIQGLVHHTVGPLPTLPPLDCDMHMLRTALEQLPKMCRGVV